MKKVFRLEKDGKERGFRLVKGKGSREKFRIYALAVKYWFRGDEWAEAVNYAAALVKGFKKRKEGGIPLPPEGGSFLRLNSSTETIKMDKLHSYDPMEEICGNCGFTSGAHHGGTSPYPYNYCPTSEDGEDWENAAGTCFKPTGNYRGRNPFLIRS